MKINIKETDITMEGRMMIEDEEAAIGTTTMTDKDMIETIIPGNFHNIYNIIY